MGLLERLKRKEKIVLAVKETKTSRIVYESEDIQRVEVSLILPTGETIILELTPKQTFKLGMDLAVAYRTINPEFKIPRGYGV